MKISVVIPALNEQKYIGKILSDLDNQTRKPDEITVVDAKSKDKTLEVVKKFKQVKVIECEPSISNQRNLGAKNSFGELIFFLDADIRIKNDFIEKASDEFEKRNLDIACPYFLTPTKHPLLIFAKYFFNLGFFIYQYFLPSGAGGCILIRKQLFDQSKGFNPTVKFEDVEFIRRASRKHKFAMLHTSVAPSLRRFYKEGVTISIVKLFFLGIFTSFGLYKEMNVVPYKMGHYED